MKQKNLVIFCGIPASGKSTWAHSHLGEGDICISRDEIRFAMVKNGEDYFSHETEVFNKFISDINENLDKGLRVFADATHINWTSRRKLLNSIIDKDTVKVSAYVFKTPIETCLERNKKRSGMARVPDSAIRRMCRNFVHPSRDPFTYENIIDIYPDYEKELK